MHVQRVVEVDAGEDGEHIGLKERDQDLKPGEGHHEAESGPAAQELADAWSLRHQTNEGDVKPGHLR